MFTYHSNGIQTDRHPCSWPEGYPREQRRRRRRRRQRGCRASYYYQA